VDSEGCSLVRVPALDPSVHFILVTIIFGGLKSRPSHFARPWRVRRSARLKGSVRRREAVIVLKPCGHFNIHIFVRRSSLPNVIRVVGIGDWAWSKGQSFGTILVDLERSEVGDLLPTRSAKVFNEWLAQHPDVVVVSRDRQGVPAFAHCLWPTGEGALCIASRAQSPAQPKPSRPLDQ
jgi:hypothetical protein